MPLMSLAPGTQLGPYKIEAPLGAGGMGEVYRARDTRLGRDVAVKILPKEMSADATRKQRFEREAKTISSLNHPHICVLYDVGHQDGTDYLVMECVEGETLAKLLEKGPLPLEQVLKYGAQIADALDKAHRSGVVRRDLKPGNIVLATTGAKLLDFGLAKPVSPLASGMTLTADTPRAAMTHDDCERVRPLRPCKRVSPRPCIQSVREAEQECQGSPRTNHRKGWRSGSYFLGGCISGPL